MNLIEILGILFIHFVADFVMQTDKQAKGKSKNFNDLLDHTWSYSRIWLIIGAIIVVSNIYYPFFTYKSWGLPLFVTITLVTHTITDYFTSRLNSRLWEKGQVHNFFVSVGFDQFLHYVQLFLTYWFLFK